MKHLRRAGIILSLVGLGLSSASPAVPAAAQTPPVPPSARFAPNEVLIQFKPGVNEAQKADARSRANAFQKKQHHTLGNGDLELAATPSGLAVADAVSRLESHPAVAFAEPNWLYEHQVSSDDPYYTNGSLWGMYGDASSPANQYGSQAGEAWVNQTGSSSIYVCVIDEGIDYRHDDLGTNVWGGYDFYNNDSTIYDSGDGDDHGTHVAGTIGAVGGNGKGVAGVNWTVKLISAKFLGPNGGYLADAVEAIDYCTQKKKDGLNVVASNNSWGGGGYSQALHDAIIRGAKAGILFVAAAGNGGGDGKGDNNDSTSSYPSNYKTSVGTSTETAASYDGVIAVTALTSSGSMPSWANYGATTVDLGAPGSGIYSTTPNNGYSSYSGTSMATPHVTGAVALYASARGGDANAIKQAILGSTIFTTSLDHRTVTGGRLDVNAALGSGGAGPSPPTVTIKSLTGSGGGDTSAPFAVVTNSDPSLVWNANEAGSYAVKVGGSDCTGAVAVSGTNVFGSYASGDVTSTISLTSLAVGANTVRVCVTDVDTNTGSTDASITRDTTAPTISAVQATNVTSSGATIAWTTDESSDSQVVYGASSNSYGSPVGSSTLVTNHSVSLSGLTTNTTYYYRVKSTDAAGNQNTSDELTFKTLASSSSTEMHVGDLAGASSNQGKDNWTATVTIIVVDGNGAPVSGASVSGSWSQGVSGSANCSTTTNSSGQCSVSRVAISRKTGSVRYSVGNIARDGWTYNASANLETTVTVTRP